MSQHLVFVHGVGPYDAPATLASVRRVAAPLGFDAAAVHAVNWRSLFKAAYRDDELQEGWVITFAASVHWMRRLESTPAEAGVLGVRPSILKAVDIAASVLELPLTLWPHLLILVPFLGALSGAIILTISLIVGSYALLLGIATAVCLNRNAAFRSFLRRGLSTIVWPIIHAALIPELLGITERAYAICVLLFIGWVFFVAVTPLASIVPLGVILLALFPIVVARIRLIYGDAFIVLSDVVRYITLPGYRDRIYRKLDEIILSLPQGSNELTLVGHSLGSVVAVDYLLMRAEKLQSFAAIRFVTFGSPLLRWFRGAFPIQSPSPAQLFSYLLKKLPDFTWVNVYRPLDPVGTTLKLPATDRSADLSTGQRKYWRAWIGSHLDYWSDMKVAQTVRRAFELMWSTSREAVRPDPEYHLNPASRRVQYLSADPLTFPGSARFPMARMVSSIMTVSIPFALMLAIARPVALMNLSEAGEAETLYQGPADGDDVAQHRTTVRCSQVKTVPTHNSFWQCHAWIEGETRLVRWAEYSLLLSRSGEEVTVRYRKNNPNVFVLVDYQFLGSSNIETWGYSMFFALAVMIFCVSILKFEQLGFYSATLWGAVPKDVCSP